MPERRKHFGKVFEGKVPGTGIPQVTLRRLTFDDFSQHQWDFNYTGDEVGIFHGADLIGFVALIDLFDEHGNRFYND